MSWLFLPSVGGVFVVVGSVVVFDGSFGWWLGWLVAAGGREFNHHQA